MEKKWSYRKCLSQELRSIFEDLEQLSAVCSRYIKDIPDHDKSFNHIDSDKNILKGEIQKLSVALQFEDILLQNFLSIDALIEEIERLKKENCSISSEEMEKLSNLISDVAGNINSSIADSLENIDRNLKRICKAISKCIPVYSCFDFDIDKTIEKIKILTESLDAEKFLPDISLTNSFPSQKKDVVPIEKSIGERLAKGFRVVEHKKILNNYYPEQKLFVDSGVLEIF